MSRKKKQSQTETALSLKEATELQEAYTNELANNPEFSLDADPEGKLHLTELQKQFIVLYIEYRDIVRVADLLLIPVDEAKNMLIQYNIQNEIRRINRAIYHHQFQHKLVSMDDIGGYLSSLLTDEYVAESERLKPIEKLRVVDLLIRLNEMKTNGMQNPDIITSKNLDMQIRNLSLTTITMLLNQSKNKDETNQAIDKLDNGSLTLEERAVLASLPTDQLLNLIEETNGGNDNGNQ